MPGKRAISKTEEHGPMSYLYLKQNKKTTLYIFIVCDVAKTLNCYLFRI